MVVQDALAEGMQPQRAAAEAPPARPMAAAGWLNEGSASPQGPRAPEEFGELAATAWLRRGVCRGGPLHDVIQHEIQSAPAARAASAHPPSLAPKDFSPGRRMYYIASEGLCYRTKEEKSKDPEGRTPRVFIRAIPKKRGSDRNTERKRKAPVASEPVDDVFAFDIPDFQ